ncbi:sugar transferase [Elusimicrobiota bacterium]
MAVLLRRFFDITTALVGLVLLSPLFLLTAVLIKIDSAGPAFFRQERIGRKFHPFLIYKFRTMTRDAAKGSNHITTSEDSRITCVGRFLRRFKIDELPQLINVLRGEMSIVGPRPEVRRYVEMFQRDYAELLTVRPGVTNLASLEYRSEEEMLARSADPESEYVSKILPAKIALAKESIRRSSLLFDLKLICLTLFTLFHREPRRCGNDAE